MFIFKWNQELETGLELVDQQHRALIKAANTFFIRNKCGQAKAAAECMSFLIQYIQYHFQTEEAYQVECSYPGYRRHQAEHQSMAARVRFFAVRMEEAGGTQAYAGEFYEFVTGWIRVHILEEDMRFCKFYNQWRGGAEG